ncbi:hypothetical protein [Segatella copri]|uniref:Uncharacterized protein n=1 Tax=Segatella copri TaxID=165179 RepID=A0AA90UUS1_9BACT|nr:hypothetical protein [Segatella copri]MQN82708.1 hypothetical protein [Segatella copri]
MAEEVIKTTSCCNDAMMGGLLGAMANRDNNNPLAMAAMMRDRDDADMWNNPFAYMMMMGMMRYMYGADWNNRDNGADVQRAEIQSQIESLRNQMADNQNSNLLMGAIQGNGNDLKMLASNLNCDFNALQTSICGIQAGIQQLGGQVGFSAERVINAISQGNLQMTIALKDCCCQTQQNIIKMGYDNQLGQKDIVNQMQQGFNYTNTGIERAASNLGFQMQQDKCDVIRAGENNTQRIIDTLTGHWSQEQANEIQDLKFKNSQLQQNIYLANLMNGGCGCGAGVAGGYQ